MTNLRIIHNKHGDRVLFGRYGFKLRVQYPQALAQKNTNQQVLNANYIRKCQIRQRILIIS